MTSPSPLCMKFGSFIGMRVKAVIPLSPFRFICSLKIDLIFTECDTTVDYLVRLNGFWEECGAKVLPHEGN